MSTVRKITEKGQVTLPAKWRKRTKANLVSFVEREGVLEVRPAKVVEDEEVLFNADRDNGGEGIPVEKFIQALERLEKEEKTQ